MLSKQGDWITLRSNEADIGGLQPGDKGIVERVNADKGVVDVLWAKGFRTIYVTCLPNEWEDLFSSTAFLRVLPQKREKIPLKRDDRMTLLSNKDLVSGLQPGDEGIVEQATTDRGVVDVLWKNGFHTAFVTYLSNEWEGLFPNADLLCGLDEALPAHPGFFPKIPKGVVSEAARERFAELHSETTIVETVEKVACVLATHPGGLKAELVIWLLEVLESETDNIDAFRVVLMNIRNRITVRLKTGLWQDPFPKEENNDTEQQRCF